MNYSFISIVASSNNLRHNKMLQIAISVFVDGVIQNQFETFIHSIPSLTKTERETLPFDYSNITTAPPFCDIAQNIIHLIQDTETVFKSKFEVALFRRAFCAIGYPIGSPSYILADFFKKNLNLKKEFSISHAMEILKIHCPISDSLDKCAAMEKVFTALFHLNQSSPLVTIYEEYPQQTEAIQLDNLPTTAGVYFFRNNVGDVIYVGKAINILRRVRSHFSSKDAFEKSLYQKTVTVDFEETGSEMIALLLESHYIQNLKPKYNSQQKEILDPYIITSKIDSKGILRIQPVQKSYTDTENEFYYNRDSVLKKIAEIQQRFSLCKRFTGIERTAKKCSDPVFCKGICQELEDKAEYNLRVKAALKYIDDQRPSYMIKLKGRNRFETGFVMVKNGLYQGYGFIDADTSINSTADMEGFIKNLTHNYFTSRIVDQYHNGKKRSIDNIVFF